ncbi:unnamed protein product [Cuscuta campestris]|uniref:Membrane protein insertion efficiency factor n=1 Tax=Cuscuta campestris TaxID=132261 RepID=A0A484MKK5_9ASTE|nr:unnamed protein product [Cuscuta campestris]
MTTLLPVNITGGPSESLHKPISPVIPTLNFPALYPNQSRYYSIPPLPDKNVRWAKKTRDLIIANGSQKNPIPRSSQGEEVDNLGVKAALSLLIFYKREISPLLPKSCRYIPTCSEYSMIAYKKYGFVKGTALTACRLCRCNPLGGSGFDPPRWFGETSPPEQ